MTVSALFSTTAPAAAFGLIQQQVGLNRKVMYVEMIEICFAGLTVVNIVVIFKIICKHKQILYI